jgi:hypothetical protein
MLSFSLVFAQALPPKFEPSTETGPGETVDSSFEAAAVGTQREKIKVQALPSSCERDPSSRQHRRRHLQARVSKNRAWACSGGH